MRGEEGEGREVDLGVGCGWRPSHGGGGGHTLGKGVVHTCLLADIALLLKKSNSN